jgi:hypothetical protein
LLPSIRPDIAILLQPDIFNTDILKIFKDIDDEIDPNWHSEMQLLMNIPAEIQFWRKQIWDLIKNPIRQQVKSFIELAVAIYKLAHNKNSSHVPLSVESTKIKRLGMQVADLLRGEVDDSMRQFLMTAVQYLTQVPKQMAEVPIDVLRALRDVERIMKIEEQALGEKEQDLLRFFILQIARLCGENG